jgi:hypothetical protein
MPASKKPVLASSVVAELKALNEEVQQADNAVKNCVDTSKLPRLQFLCYNADFKLKQKVHEATKCLAAQCKGLIPESVQNAYGVKASAELSLESQQTARKELTRARNRWLEPSKVSASGGVDDEEEDGKLVV